jgi:hypothetical protein
MLGKPELQVNETIMEDGRPARRARPMQKRDRLPVPHSPLGGLQQCAPRSTLST